MTGIAGAGAYAPRNRLRADEIADAWGRTRARGIESVAVPGPDEDALTMAAAAGRRALDAAGIDPGTLAGLAFASTTPPLEEEDLTPRLGSFLGLPADAVRRYVGRSTRAGTRAILAARDAGAFPALAVAADCPRGEPNSPEGHAAGAAAGAIVLTEDARAELWASGEYAADYPGTRFRRRGEDRVEGLGVTAYDREAYTETVAGAVASIDVDPDPDALAITAPDGDLPARAARTLGIDPDSIATPVETLGDVGAAGPLVGLARAFESGAARTLVVGYGSGAGADALIVDRTAPANVTLDRGRWLTYPEALRLRGEITSGPPAGGGAAVSVPTWRRSRAARYRLEAGRCPECGALAFPPDGACLDCHALVAYDAVELPREGRIETVTGISPDGAPPEFLPQAERGGDFPVAIVEFERNGRAVSVPLQVCDAGGGDVEADEEVTAVVRRVYEDEGVIRYGAKAQPS